MKDFEFRACNNIERLNLVFDVDKQDLFLSRCLPIALTYADSGPPVNSCVLSGVRRAYSVVVFTVFVVFFFFTGRGFRPRPEY